MAKKKKAKKKFHGSKAVKKKKRLVSPTVDTAAAANEPVRAAESTEIVQEANTQVEVPASTKTASISASDEHYYVKADVWRSFVLSGSIVAFLIGLWLLFEHTGLGPAVYHLIKI